MAAQSSQDLKNTFIGHVEAGCQRRRNSPLARVISYRYKGRFARLISCTTPLVAWQWQIMQPHRPQFAFPATLDTGTPEEIKAAFEGYGAYFWHLRDSRSRRFRDPPTWKESLFPE